jgi:hypothetical protein
VAGNVDIDGRGALHGVLESANRRATGDELDNVLSARVLRGQLVADVAPEAAGVVAHAVGPRVLGGRGRYGWAHGSRVFLACERYDLPPCLWN